MTIPKERPAVKEKLWTVEDVSSYLRVSPSTVYKWVDEKRLPCIDLGADGRKRVIRFIPTEIEGMVHSTEVRP